MTNIPIKPQLLTVRQVALILQYHPNTILNYIAEGKLQGVNPNGKRHGATGLRITVESLIKFQIEYRIDEFDEDEFYKKIEQHTQRPSKMRVISSGIQI